MRPQPDNRPPGLLESYVGVLIASPVPFNLLPPPNRVRLRPRAVCRTAVPEAAIHKDGDARFDEDKIGAPTKSR
jgi:hypothetical protein